jgi:beta-glucosidase
VTLTRTGRRPARETAQAYARDRVTSVTWTDREVKAFTHVDVEPGEWVEVMILVPPVTAPSSPLGTPRRRTG